MTVYDSILLSVSDGRDPYFDLNRKLWRLWHWTTESMDAPVDVTVVHAGTDANVPHGKL